MIHQIFDILRTELNSFLIAQSPENLEAKVAFMGEEPSDSVKFPSNSICPILIRIEEEKMLRQDDRYVRSKNQSTYLSAPPGIPLHLYVMFVARYKDYLEGLKNLSHVIRFFQARPMLTNGLPPNVADLRVELHTLAPSALNEVWGMLRTPLHPSVVYKISLLMMEMETPESSGKVIKEGGISRELNPMKPHPPYANSL